MPLISSVYPSIGLRLLKSEVMLSQISISLYFLYIQGIDILISAAKPLCMILLNASPNFVHTYKVK